MVFSSLPSYLDPPNWPQQQPAGGGGGDHEISQLPPPLFPPPPPVGSGGGTGRPGSMSERARLAKLPQPEAAMKCPRCESTNTKFCYFNNYSLSQPRHFCKTCRRYWTRGGALRNVPVGGGCRRNKRSSSKGSRSKSPATTTSSTSNNSSAISPSRCTTDILGHLAHPQPPQFPILPPLHHLGDHYGGGDNIGLTFGGGNGLDLIQIGNSSYPSSKLAQFPFLEASNGGIYQFESSEGPSNYGVGAAAAQFGSKTLNSGVFVNQAGGMKVEEDHNHHHHHEGLNLSRNFLSISGNEQFSGTSNVAWSTTDLSGFTSSSTATHLL